MSSEQDKRPSLVPLGVFGTTPSAQPSPSASTTSHGTVTAPVVPPPRPVAPPPPASPALPKTLIGTPSVASPEPGSQPPADRPSFPKTLVGVPTSVSPEVVARASRGDFPAPPKWQGAAAYNAGAPPLRTSSGGPMPPGAQPPPAAPSSATSASAQPSSPFPLAKDAPVLGRVNLRPAAVPVAAVEVTGRLASAPPRADDTEEELDLRDAIEERALFAPRAPAAGVSARSVPGPPPQQLESKADEGAPAQPATRSSIPPVIVPNFARKDPSEVNIPLAAPAPVPAPAALPAPVPAPVPVPAPRPRVEVDPGAPQLGFIFVAFMVLIGVGGWLATQGGFVRPRHPEVAATTRPDAKKPVPLAAPLAEPAPVAAPAEAAPVAPEPVPPVVAAEPPSAAAEEPAPVAEPTPVPAPAPRSGGSEPRAKRPESLRPPAAVRPPPAPRAEPPPPPAQQQPTLTITPQGHTREPAAPASTMSDTPTRQDVTRALDAVRAQVSACTAGKHGVAEVDLTVLSTGDVSHVVVTGDFAGTPEGSCIAREVRAAHFSPFLKPRFRLIYPFQL